MIEFHTPDLIELKAKIEQGRAYGRRVLTNRAAMAGVLAGCPGSTGVEFEFPEPDTMHAYQTMFGHRVGEPTTFRLSFSDPLKWVGVSHPWGMKPGDIVVEE